MARFEFLVSFETDDVNLAGAVSTVVQDVISSAGVASGYVGKLTQLEPGVTNVYTDGGCDAKKNIGAWAFRVEGADSAEGTERFGALTHTTNNRMELMAAIRALEHLEIGPAVRIYSDSEYVIKGATLWIKGWIKRNWKTFGNTPVKNQDLWEHLNKLVTLHNVTFVHVKGHSGNPGNERVDELCTLAMAEALSSGLDGVPQDVGLPVKNEHAL